MAARSVTSWPLRASSSKSNPPVLPMPGMAGGLKDAMFAAGSALSWGVSAAMMPVADSRAVVRCAHGLSTAITVPAFASFVLLTMLKPDSSIVFATPGFLRAISPTWVTTACVRSSDAPSGRVMLMKK